MHSNYIKISELNHYIKSMFEENPVLRKVYVKGEVSNFKCSRGHLYFTLKDEESRLSAVMFASSARGLSFTPEDGNNVLVEGRISCYTPQGTYQIYVDKMDLDGIGNLYVEYEKLKKKLALEGLFDSKYKKPIPKYPKRIGIVTASTGAAIHDILSTIKRRYPLCETILFPSLVQGASAAPEIVRQINKAQEFSLDVLIVGRGGGSIEDLWAFNEESVARAIFASTVPVISAVGHEVDFTIADFVADLRALTPTGAAEMAVPSKDDLLKLLQEKRGRINQYMVNSIRNAKNKLNYLENHYILKNPMAMYELKEQKLDSLIDRLNNSLKTKIEQSKNSLMRIQNHYILKNPLANYLEKAKEIENYQIQANHAIFKIIKDKEHTTELYINKIELLNPLNILKLGYGVVRKDKKVIKSSADIKVKDEINIKLNNGEVIAEVKEII